MLYLVATPIGNLKDITTRAREVLQSVDLILCEDTRTTGKLFNLLGLKPYPPLLSYHEHNEVKRIPEVIALLKEEKDIALVSDAGTPTLADPGYKLVRECVQLGIKVTPIPGPSSLISALIASGFPTDKFIYIGFLPKTTYKRSQLFTDLKRRFTGTKITVVAFESPRRLEKSLEDIKNSFGDISIALCQELTKLHEKITVNLVSVLLEKRKKSSKKGEITLVWEIK